MDYAVLFHRLYDREPTGLAEDTLARAEQRLGHAIPRPLSSLYLACGLEPSVMAIHDRFIAPRDLGLTDGRLVFCEENQGVCVWGCDPGVDDPAVEAGNVLRDRTHEWVAEGLELSRFLELVIYQQTAWGGFEHVGDLQDPEGVMSTLEAEWTAVVRRDGLTIYEKPGLLITSFDGDGFLTAAARTAERFAYLERELGFNPM